MAELISAALLLVLGGMLVQSHPGDDVSGEPPG